MARRRPTEPTANATRGAVLVVAAVVIGLVLLRNGLDTSETFTPSTTDGSTSETDDSASTDGTAADEGADSTDSSAVTTRTPQEVPLIVLNDAGVTGAAGKYSDYLAGLGYALTNTAGDTASLQGDSATTQVLYVPDFQAEAAVVAAAIGAAATSVQPLGTTLPGTIAGASVIVVLGTDIANVDPTPTAGT
jgi:hypothetical protein